MVQQFDTWARALGPYGFLAFFLAAFIEYVFPPFPGDTVTLLGGVYTVRGGKPWLLMFLSVTAGSVLGAAVNYGFGRLIATRVERQPDGRLFFGLSHARIHRAQAAVRAKGATVILANRFIPALRGLIFVAAGASRMPVRRVLLYGAISAMAWNLLVMGLGVAVGGNAEWVAGFLQQYNRMLLGVLAIAALALLVRYLRRLGRSAKGAP